MLTSTTRLRTSGLPCDFTLIVDGQEFPVHKSVLFCHSDVLFKMSTNAAFVECQTGRAVLKDVEALHVQTMVEYMYTQTYKFEAPDSASDTDSVTSLELFERSASTSDFDMEMIILADQYNVAGLKQLAMYNLSDALQDSSYDAGKFAILVNKIYAHENLPESVLRHAIKTAALRIECLYSKDPAKLLETRPDFALEVFKCMVKTRGQMMDQKIKAKERQRRILSGLEVSDDDEE